MGDSIIDATRARKLIQDQFPQWGHLDVAPVARSGWDNRTFHLGDELSLRFPSDEEYAAQVEKEQTWLPRLAPHLPLDVPAPVAMGRPGQGYPWRWSVLRWLPGDDAEALDAADDPRLATDLGAFLRALQQADVDGAPPPGAHNFWRGGPLSTYDAETREALSILGDRVDGAAALSVWEAASRTTWSKSPVWLHGDVAASNLIVSEGRLSAVIDFGCAGTGDPACDLAIAWVSFSRDARAAFRSTLDVDDETWERGRAWALWKALIILAGIGGTNPAWAPRAERTMSAILDA